MSYNPIIKSGRSARRRGAKRRGLRWLVYLVVFLTTLGLLAGGVLFYAQWKFNNSDQVIDKLDPRKPDEPMNTLILGSDTRENLTAEEKKTFGSIGGKRADTIMLLHLDEKREKAVLIHFPRDLRVEYPSGKVGKINGVYEKGPEAVIETVKDFTGLPISHYVEVDFNGFNEIVDKLGGVDIYFAKALKDADSGLNVPKGCVTVEGDQALAFVRVRKIDDDFGRIARQQLFVRLMMDKIISARTLLNPAKIVKLVNLFSANVKHDANLSLDDVRSIAFRVRGFDSTKVDMRVVPSAGARINKISYVVANERQTDALFTAIRERRTLPDFGRTGASSVEPADVNVTVLNGTDVDKLARTEANNLSNKGFVTLGTSGTTPHRKTTVYYGPDNEEKARLLAGNYGAALKVMPPPILDLSQRADVVLVLGEDFAAGTATPPPPAQPGTPGAAKPMIRACD